MPAITSEDNDTFTTGTTGTFLVTAAGFPTPTVSTTSHLPKGLAFHANSNGSATISGKAATGTGGTYVLTLTAGNKVGTNATQVFTLTVDQVPGITSATSSTFSVGTAGSFHVVATGFPAPTVTETGTLPAGVTFNNSTNLLSGTPETGTGGTYKVTLTADNGIGSDAGQTFTLTVKEPASITSADTTNFTSGNVGTFTVTTGGFPAAVLSEKGTLPSGLKFLTSNDGTAEIAGTTSWVGTYTLTLSATNKIGTVVVQTFTLIVGAEG